MIAKGFHARCAATLLASVMLAALAACAPAKVEPLQDYRGGALPRPELVVVADFTTTPDEVKLDTGLGARLRNIVSGTSSSTQQSEVDRKVTAAISTTLVAEIQKMGLAALRSSGPVATTASNKLIVAGEILSIDEGNRTRRNLIGLGAGRSAVEARADVYYNPANAEPRFVESFAADAESGRKPGAVETMGAGAATGRIAESAAVNVGSDIAPALSGDVTADGERMAKAIAKRLGAFFVSQGWIPASAAP